MKELIEKLQEIAALAEQSGNIMNIDYTDPKITWTGREPLRIHVRDLHKLDVPLDDATFRMLNNKQYMRAVKIAPGIEAVDVIDDCKLVASEVAANA
jgi:hypothetical protein